MANNLIVVFDTGHYQTERIYHSIEKEEKTHQQTITILLTLLLIIFLYFERTKMLFSHLLKFTQNLHLVYGHEGISVRSL